MFAFSDLRIHGRSRIVVALAVTIVGIIGVAPRIGRITPKGEVAAVSTGRLEEVYLQGITVGPDGNLWFTQDTGIGRIGTGRSKKSRGRTALPAVCPRARG